MGLLLLRSMIMRAGRGRKATVRRKTRRRRSKKTEEGDKHLLWGRRRNSLTDNFTLAVYMRFLVAADTCSSLTARGGGLPVGVTTQYQRSPKTDEQLAVVPFWRKN